LNSTEGPLEIFVVTAPGLEEITRGELGGLGLTPQASDVGGLSLQGDRDTLWALNLHLRTASRILVRVARFRAVGFRDLERRGREIPWHAFLPAEVPPDEVAFEVTCRKSRLYHSGAVEARLREALAASGAGRPGGRGPRRDRGGSKGALPPPPRFVVRLVRNRLTLSADASGTPLHRRGYREAVGKAPLRETVAAALLLAGEWRGETALVDPFCGSGTIPIEAALLARGSPPGLRRRFAFEAWSGGSPEEGAAARSRAWGEEGEPSPAGTLPPILGSDRDEGAVASARANARRAGVETWVDFSRAAVSTAPLPDPPGILVTNPPYGHRVGDPATLRNLYARLGARIRSEWSGGRIVLLSADRGLAVQLGLETRVLFRTRIGGIPVEALAAEIP
jgi:putative N6-adenine-specific DNA methylase